MIKEHLGAQYYSEMQLYSILDDEEYDLLQTIASCPLDRDAYLIDDFVDGCMSIEIKVRRV